MILFKFNTPADQNCIFFSKSLSILLHFPVLKTCLHNVSNQTLNGHYKTLIFNFLFMQRYTITAIKM